MKKVKLLFMLIILLCACTSCNDSDRKVNEEIELLDNIMISVPIWRDKWVNEKHFNLLLDAEVDMVVAVSGIENETFDTSRHMIEVAHKTKRDDSMIKVLVHANLMTDEILKYSEEEIESLFKEFKGDKAVGGYHLIDEPFNPNPFARIERVLKAYDPEKIVDLNFFPGLVYGSYDEFFGRLDDYLKLVGDKASYLSFDNYPFANGTGTVDESQLFGNFEAIRKAGLINDVPTAFYLQAVGGFNNSYRKPDEGTLRYHTSSALAYGFKWIKYWSWFVPDYGNPEETYSDYSDAIIGKDGEPTEMYYVVSEMHKEIHTVGSTLAKLDAVDVYHTGSKSSNSMYEKIPGDYFIKPRNDEYAIVSLLRHRANNDYYLMIVNKDMVNRQDFSFSLSGIDLVEELSKTQEGKKTEKDIKENILNLSLSAGDFVLYKISGDLESKKTIVDESNILSSAKIYANDSYSGEGWYIGKAFDGVYHSAEGSLGYRVKSGGEKFFEFELLEEMSFNRISIYPARTGYKSGNAFPDNFKLYKSNDGVTWDLIIAESNIPQPQFIVPSYSFKSQTAKFVKLVIESKEGFGYEVAEVRVFDDKGSYSDEKTKYSEPIVIEGENIALGKIPFASGSAYESVVDKWGLKYINDGSKMKTEKDGTNGWMSNAVKDVKETTFVGINLGASYNVNRIIIYPRQNGGFFPIDYDVQVSVDQENWFTVAEMREDEGLLEGRVIDFDPIEARYVRVLSRTLRGEYLDSFSGYIMQISEIEVYVD